MPPSQLKSLKKSLRDQGVVGPQKSKKEKKAQKSSKSSFRDRNAALQNIRDNFNPFELRQPSRPAKFESVSHASANKAANAGRYKEVLHRPGVTKSAGEEARRRQLLPEMQRRNKVGGLVDRRIGEGDPGMTPEERAVQRFAREKEGRKGGRSLFDLEGSDDDEPKLGLTHLGKSLNEFEEDDFVDDVSGGEEDGDSEDDGFMRRKRRRSDEDEVGGEQDSEQQPERKKSKKEVMEEVIAKSKMHKYERQKVKEDDEDLRDELDKGMQEMLAMLRGHKPPPKDVQQEAEAALANGDGNGTQMNPDRQRLLDGMDRSKADKEYEVRLRQLAQDARAKPSDRTKTDEEKTREEAERLQELEEKRTKRMRGEAVSDEESADDDADKDDEKAAGAHDVFGNEDLGDEAAEFGFTSSVPVPKSNRPEEEERVQHDDEDDFDVDADLIADESDVDTDDESEQTEGSGDDEGGDNPTAARDEEEDDEFVKGILGDSSTDRQPALTGANGIQPGKTASGGLAFTYPCPRSHAELLDIMKDVPTEQQPIIVQRVRALYHPSLSASNKDSMADFSSVLVEHIAYLGNTHQPLATIEQIIRHIHSLSRTYPLQIGEAFRKHLQALHEFGKPVAGDLVIFTAIGSIFPTSDHFHQVVTPAITLMARWLGLTVPDTAERRATGAFITALCIKYQNLAKRVVPEAVRFTLKTLSLGSKTPAKEMRPHLDNLAAMTDLWKDKRAFQDMFAPFLPLLRQNGAKKELQHLSILLQQAAMRRRPLELHHHKKQPIPTRIPKFEEGFNPDKHYDPDKERSEAAKLQKEYKRERKGALRELRKDANFMAREQLKEKREKDAEYERKQRRLIAEIQGEEGRESKEYAREKEQRKKAKGRM
ncbi:hypothetical protein B0A50_07853 [Salinomyces thailandicus]|uniref:Nop14-like protein n=1 Tax=Salinomyces thailandicus TaxID=706561 RepID=A0A4U0TLX8_9PEZI|nr:hypothetical protein B0A50_07853 [Salinomyces thailandica]